MEDKQSHELKEVLDSEVDDLWDIFFPYMVEKKEKHVKPKLNEETKPRRHLKFLTMNF